MKTGNLIELEDLCPTAAASCQISLSVDSATFNSIQDGSENGATGVLESILSPSSHITPSAVPRFTQSGHRPIYSSIPSPKMAAPTSVDQDCSENGTGVTVNVRADGGHGQMIRNLLLSLPFLVVTIVLVVVLYFLLKPSLEIVDDPVVAPDPFVERNGTGLAAMDGIKVDPLGGLPLFQ